MNMQSNAPSLEQNTTKNKPACANESIIIMTQNIVDL